jgi:hypothetical protein
MLPARRRAWRQMVRFTNSCAPKPPSVRTHQRSLGLVAVGLYAVLSYLTAQRGRELGIRMALGAHASEMTATVVAEGLKPVVGGMLIGLAAAAAAFGLVDPQRMTTSRRLWQPLRARSPASCRRPGACRTS